jgi:hypothetical protein
MAQQETTAAERHYQKTHLLTKLAKEVCPCCARGETLYAPTKTPGSRAIDHYDYHHSDARTCFANDLFKWGKEVGILFTSYTETPPKQG